MSEWDNVLAAIKRLDAPFSLRMKSDGAFRPDRKRQDILQQEGVILYETIAEGSFSKIKRAFYKKEVKEVAVKVIPKRKGPDEYYEKFLPREIATLRVTQEHPLVVDMYAALEGPNAYYLIMEHCERGDLLDYVNKLGFLNEVEARGFFRQMTDAVQYLHHMGIVHRDIKLENMLLNKDYEIRIADFGFSRFHGDDLSDTKCGSFVYSAPEIFLGNPYNGTRADAWSLGVCLYAMVCGRLPLAQTKADLRDPHVLLTAAHRKIHFTKLVTSACRRVARALMCPAPDRRASLDQVRRGEWLSMVMRAGDSGAAVGASWSSISELRPRPSQLSAAAAQTGAGDGPPGTACDQRHGPAQPRQPVRRVLKSLATHRARGRSRQDMLGGRPGDITGVAGPIGRQLSLEVLHEQHGAGQRDALRRQTSSSVVLMKSEAVMQAAQSRTHIQVRSELNGLKHTLGGMAAKAAKQEQKSANKKNAANDSKAKMRWKAAVLAMKRHRFAHWRELCQKLAKLPVMRIEEAEHELDAEENFDYTQF